MALLKALNISHKFDFPLFDSLSFELEKSKSMSIVGVSGCGKSTLLHCCSTLLKPNSGDIIFNENSIYGKNSQDRLDVRRKYFGIIFQSHYLFKGFNAKENIELASLLNETDFEEEIVDRLGIKNILHKRVGELSGGQQQRVSIARVLMKKPRIIFADEPTGNLDQKTAKEVMDVLFEYIKNSNASLMLVTHDLNLAKRCDNAYALKDLNLHEV
ncbi:MAG: ABC transporter ATP-binding protein [Sulfurospirillaceae bacterium]|nr:ABC transporter ATP-binding protein [Sulfurospirillaceae bacterium]MCK9545897.1 ABC transporter ATP-binding protein [Sulfurospirillaceae bacterium]